MVNIILKPKYISLDSVWFKDFDVEKENRENENKIFRKLRSICAFSKIRKILKKYDFSCLVCRFQDGNRKEKLQKIRITLQKMYTCI